MNHEIEHPDRLPMAKQSGSSLSEKILNERIQSFSSADTSRRRPQTSDDFVSIEIHVNKKAIDAICQTCNSAMNFFPNLILEGAQATQRGIRQAERQVTGVLSDAEWSWNHGIGELKRGFTDSSIQTYKAINCGAEQIQRGAVTVAVEPEHVARSAASRVQKEVSSAVHVAESFAQRTTHDAAKAASSQLRQWAAAIDPDPRR